MTAGGRGDMMLVGRVTAGTELIARTGASDFELAYDDDGPVRWWAGANWRGTRMFSEHFPYPAQAVEDLLSRVVNGGHCKRCKRTTIVGIVGDAYCSFIIHADDLDEPETYRYVRSCEEPQSDGSGGTK